MASVLRWLRSRSDEPAPGGEQALTREPAERLPVNFPACLAEEFAQDFPVAWTATEGVLDAIRGHDLRALERRSPGLRNYDWSGYLRCSSARLVRVARQLRAAHVDGPVLDLGAYFGNASLMCRAIGYEVDAVDSYGAYEPALGPSVALMRAHGVRVLDFAETGYDLAALPADRYGAVLCLGVIEHVPHTPRPLLQAVKRVLRPGGLLLLDTPNIAYLYNRRRLARGESIMAPIATQFDSDIPFEGHHREYSPAEVQWMLERIGLEAIGLETFNYSFYALPELAGDDLECYRQMEADPSARELILATARKPHA
jgi:2-polyprenyl-3-methyl-5-hydroxy-6-metoxy-1,4-benzoquinol methylase